jgi:uncharacterized protein YndB with AHSA1/START domain
MKKTQVHIKAEVRATIKKAWEYYTLPLHIVNWNFATDDWQCPSAENNLIVGGTYKVRMEAKDGTFGFDFEATYTNIEVGQGFTYIITDGREVNVKFKNLGNSTLVTIDFEAESQNPVELQEAGWLAILNNFKKYIESN